MNNVILTSNSNSTFVPNNSLQKDIQIILGKNVAEKLSESEIDFLSKMYSQKLAKHKETMLQLTKFQLKKIINSGLMIIAIDKNTKEIIAGGRIMFHKNHTYEFCSWVAFKKGFGKIIINSAKKLALSLDKAASLYSVIQKDNIYAQIALEKTGAKKLNSKPKDLVLILEKSDGKKADAVYFEL